MTTTAFPNLNEVSRKWHNEATDLPPVGTRCLLVLEENPEIPDADLERNGKEVEIIAHICNGNLAVCVCYDHWALNDVGEWWVAAFNSAAFKPIDEPRWPSVGTEPGARGHVGDGCDDQYAPEPDSRAVRRRPARKTGGIQMTHNHLNREPDDAYAPEWAVWKAQDCSGEWWWFHQEPSQIGESWVPDDDDLCERASEGYAVEPHWRDTLKGVVHKPQGYLHNHLVAIQGSSEDFEVVYEGSDEVCVRDSSGNLSVVPRSSLEESAKAEAVQEMLEVAYNISHEITYELAYELYEAISEGAINIPRKSS